MNESKKTVKADVADDGAGISRKDLQAHIDGALDAVVAAHGPFVTPRQKLRVVRAVLRFALVRLAELTPLHPMVVMQVAGDVIGRMIEEGVPTEPAAPVAGSSDAN